MGGKSTTTKTTRTYGNTTTKNPYVVSKTTNKGTTTNFQPNTALGSVYNFTNSNIDNLLNEYLNPSLNSTTNQAKLNAFSKTLNEQSKQAMENNIISPLAQRNMIRSSQASDMYNNLSNRQTEALADYTNSLLGESQSNTADIINNLMNMIMQGYNVVSNNQAQSLNTSSGNATSNSKSTSYGTNIGDVLKTMERIKDFK